MSGAPSIIPFGTPTRRTALEEMESACKPMSIKDRRAYGLLKDAAMVCAHPMFCFDDLITSFGVAERGQEIHLTRRRRRRGDD